MQKKTNRPVLLCILDGFGIGDPSDSHNAIAQARMPNYTRFLSHYPHSQLVTSGLDVGLPEGQMGNSEVGHMTIGAGRIIFQDLPRINNAIDDGSLEKNPKIIALIESLKKSGRACHLLGLLSDGGVHSHQTHITFLANILAKNGVKVFVHAFLDGRDVAQKSALNFLEKFSAETKNVKLATVSGRYYAMDRDKKWDRIKLAYDAIVSASSKKFPDAISAVNEAYAQNITDEFVLPCVLEGYTGIEDDDALLFCNFRADRARQISDALLNPNFREFETAQIRFSTAISMSEYSEKLNEFYQVLFPPEIIKNSLPEILEARGLTQLRIAETEKYAHVTFFFSCGREKEFSGEERILIKSPAVATYDLQPEMSAKEIGEKLVEAINSEKFDFIIVNYANPDMVGHSGLLNPSIMACEMIDSQLGMLEKAILQKDGVMLISADHGNIECMQDEHHHPHTAHTTNPVPFILIGNDVMAMTLDNGRLSDIAPTVLQLMNLEKPAEMSGKNLIKN